MLEGITVPQGQYLVLSHPDSSIWQQFFMVSLLPLLSAPTSHHLLTLCALGSLDFFSSWNAIGLFSPSDVHKYCSFCPEHGTQPPLTTSSPTNFEFSFQFHLNISLVCSFDLRGGRPPAISSHVRLSMLSCTSLCISVLCSKPISTLHTHTHTHVHDCEQHGSNDVSVWLSPHS